MQSSPIAGVSSSVRIIWVTNKFNIIRKLNSGVVVEEEQEEGAIAYPKFSFHRKIFLEKASTGREFSPSNSENLAGLSRVNW